MANNTNTIKRTYGKERNFGDVIYNPQTKSVFCNIELGFFGRTTLTLIKREDGGFDLMKPYVDKQGQDQVAMIGKTFPAKRKDGTIILDVTKGTLGLFKRYDKESKKNLTDNSDALFITTFKLKEAQKLGDTGLLKVGYISGQFGMEIDGEQTQKSDNSYTYEDMTDEEIPF